MLNERIAFGTTFTAIAALLFAIIEPSAPYWAYGFPAPIVSVFGADFVFAAGTLFVAKVSLPHEQSLAGGIFQTLTQVQIYFFSSVHCIFSPSVDEAGNCFRTCHHDHRAQRGRGWGRWERCPAEGVPCCTVDCVWNGRVVCVGHTF